jgi:rubrerythrin
MDFQKSVAIAMKGEIEGRELYTMAASRTEDKKAKDVFTYLAEEENKHYEWLKGMYDSLVKGKAKSGAASEVKNGVSSPAFVMPKMEKLVRFEDASSPIFSREFKSGIGKKHFEMSALSIAVRLELEASRFYKKMADESADEALKSFFSNLADWEIGHYRALNQEIKFLEDEYFQSNNFSPS